MPQMWEQPLTEERKEKIIEKISTEVTKRKLETPTILFLEMHKPVANIAGHAAIAVSPFVMPFFGFENTDDYSQFFSKRENIEELIRSLEVGRAQRKEADIEPADS